MHLQINGAIGTPSAVIKAIAGQVDAIKAAIAANVADPKQPKPDTTATQLDAVLAYLTAEVNAVQSTGVNVATCVAIVMPNGVRSVQINITPINILI